MKLSSFLNKITCSLPVKAVCLLTDFRVLKALKNLNEGETFKQLKNLENSFE